VADVGEEEPFVDGDVGGVLVVGGVGGALIGVPFLSAFRPRGVPGPTSKLSLCVPAQMGRRETEHKGENSKGNRGLVLSAPRADALAVGGYKRSRGRERARALCVGPFSRAATLSYEVPGPSFYRCKEKAQVYNGGVAMC
jgi:hypothetical protein